MDIYSSDLVSAQREYLLALDGAEQAKESSLSESRGMMEGLRDAARSRLKIWGMTDRQIAELELSRQPKKVVTIQSPVAGVVMERLVTAGQYVNEGTPLFFVGSLTSVWVYAELYERPGEDRNRRSCPGDHRSVSRQGFFRAGGLRRPGGQPGDAHLEGPRRPG